MNKKYIIVLSLFAGLCLPTTAQESNEEQTDKFVGHHRCRCRAIADP